MNVAAARDRPQVAQQFDPRAALGPRPGGEEMNKGARVPGKCGSGHDPFASVPRKRPPFRSACKIYGKLRPSEIARSRMRVLRLWRMLQMLRLLLRRFRMLQQLSSHLRPGRSLILARS